MMHVQEICPELAASLSARAGFRTGKGTGAEFVNHVQARLWPSERGTVQFLSFPQMCTVRKVANPCQRKFLLLLLFRQIQLQNDCCNLSSSTQRRFLYCSDGCCQTNISKISSLPITYPVINQKCCWATRPPPPKGTPTF